MTSVLSILSVILGTYMTAETCVTSVPAVSSTGTMLSFRALCSEVGLMTMLHALEQACKSKETVSIGVWDP